MPTNISIFTVQDFIRVAPDGTLDLFASRELLRALSEMAEAAGVSHVLIDTRGAEVRLSTFDLFELGMVVASHSRLSKSRTALLVPRNRRPDARFFEDVTTNRGVNLKVFVDFEAGIHWLILNERCSTLVHHK